MANEDQIEELEALIRSIFENEFTGKITAIYPL